VCVAQRVIVCDTHHAADTASVTRLVLAKRTRPLQPQLAGRGSAFAEGDTYFYIEYAEHNQVDTG